MKCQDPFLAITWEPDFSQACSFCRMLMNHKNFCFTQIPDKTNDVIFLKSSKTLFLGHFWPFLVIFARLRFFSKNLTLSHTTLYEPITLCWVSEKTNEPIPRKLTDRQKDEWTDPVLQDPSDWGQRSNKNLNIALNRSFKKFCVIQKCVFQKNFC